MGEKKLNTRQDFENLMLDILNPLKPYYSTKKARPDHWLHQCPLPG